MGKTLRYIKSVKRLTAAAFLLTLSGFCCQTVSVFSPAWYYTEQNMIVSGIKQVDQSPKWWLYEGIWMARFCRHGHHCIVDSRENVFIEMGIADSLSPLDETHWREFKILSAISLVGAIASVIACIVAFVRNRGSQKTHICEHIVIQIVAEFGAVISFSTLLIPALKLCALIEDNHFTSSWSMIVAVIGSGFQFFAAFVLIIAILQDFKQLHRLKLRCKRRSDRLRMDQNFLRFLNDCQRQNSSNENPEARSSDITSPPLEMTSIGMRDSRDSGVVSFGLRNSMSTISSVVSGDSRRIRHTPSLPPPYKDVAALPAYSEITGAKF